MAFDFHWVGGSISPTLGIYRRKSLNLFIGTLAQWLEQKTHNLLVGLGFESPTFHHLSMKRNNIFIIFAIILCLIASYTVRRFAVEDAYNRGYRDGWAAYGNKLNQIESLIK